MTVMARGDVRALCTGGILGVAFGAVLLGSMDQAIAARKSMEQIQRDQQVNMEHKRGELLEAMQYRKKLDLLDARAALERRRRRERQDQQLLDERAWRRSPLQKGERA